MSNVIQIGGSALFRLDARDDSEQSRTVTGTVSTDDIGRTYVAKVPSTGNQYCLKIRPTAVVPAGGTMPVNVTVSAVDDRGVSLSPQVFPFVIQGPPLPPAATHVVISEGPFIVDGSYVAPADPGSGTISL